MPREVTDPIVTNAQHTIFFTVGSSDRFGLDADSTGRAYLIENERGGVASGFTMWIDDTSHKTVVSSTATAESFLTGAGCLIT